MDSRLKVPKAGAFSQSEPTIALSLSSSPLLVAWSMVLGKEGGGRYRSQHQNTVLAVWWEWEWVWEKGGLSVILQPCL